MAYIADSSDIDDVLDRYRAVLANRHLPIFSIYLFGSYAKGVQREQSDIDVAVFWDVDTLNCFEADVQLLKLTRAVDLRIEPHSFSRSDLRDPDPFVREILAHGRQLK